jgi:hypothetical protein
MIVEVATIDDGLSKRRVAKPEVRNIMIANYILNKTIQLVPMVRWILLLATDILVSELTQFVPRFYPVLYILSKAVFIAQAPQPRR